MAISDWPHPERPREKLLARGADALSDAELLAIFLRTGARGKTAIDLARGLLSEFGGLRTLLEASAMDLCRVEGVGQAKYVQLQAGLELGRRYLRARLFRGKPLRDSHDSSAYLAARLRGYPFEVFACLFLDARHRPIAFEELFRGTIDGASVHPREVVKRALDHRAGAVILAHNHPSGMSEPSASDRALTRRLQAALALIDIRLLDHVVVGDQQVTSFADRGWL